MVKYIKIRNFKGISSEVYLNLEGRTKRASNFDEMSDKNILYFSALLGKNASGKTSFLDAISTYASLCGGTLYRSVFRAVRNQILRDMRSDRDEYSDSHRSSDDIDVKHEVVVQKIINDNAHDNREDIYFQFTYQYDSKEVIHSLTFNEKELIEEIEMKENNRTLHNIRLEKEISDEPLEILNFLDEQNIKPVASDSFNYRDILYMGIAKSTRLQADLRNEKEKELFLKWLQIADDKITNIILKNNGQIQSYELYDAEKDFHYQVMFQQLSTGTRKWTFLYDPIVDALTGSKSFLAIDEIDIALHNSLTQFLIQLFIDEETNKKGSQLLVTTHNPYVIRDEIRKDSINLIIDNEIRNQGRDDKLRKDKSFIKNYLSENIGDHPQPDDRINFMESLKRKLKS